jgi:hypothetical protein
MVVRYSAALIRCNAQVPAKRVAEYNRLPWRWQRSLAGVFWIVLLNQLLMFWR